MTRFDKFLVSGDWDNCFENLHLSLLPKPLFDHFPILLKGGGSLSKGPTVFWLENM